jgi:preprotein translocase subunit SecG
LTRTTWILGAIFFILGLALTIIAGRERGAASVVDRMKVNAINPAELNNQLPQPPEGTAQPGPAGAAPAPLTAPAPTIGNPFAAPAPQAPPPTAPPAE